MEELYRLKGELVTTIEVAQARLQSVNKQIVDKLNEQKQEIKPIEV